MNILCPSCQSSIPVSDTDPLLRCDSCGLETDLSRLGTYPGGAPVPMVRDLCGETLDGYRITELIGVGGMGVVYRAERTSDGRVVAVKVLHDSYTWKRQEFVARFAREAHALTRLDHPGIVRILDSGQTDDVYYLVTEHVEGTDLARQLRAKELTLPEIVAIMTRVCQAITYAHEQGVVHRDIKPANIMVAGDEVKVLDFGLAQIAGGETHLSSLTRTDLAIGTFNYLSPEQRTSAKHVDERSDVFSLGVVLYELLTGTLPLGSFAPPSSVRPEAGKLCDRIVSRSLSADPAARYQTVAAMTADLRQVEPATRRRRPLIIAAAAGLAGVAAAAILAFGLGMLDEPDESETAPQQLIEDQADRGQIPPFVDVGQIQQAIDSADARANQGQANEDAKVEAQQVKTEPIPAANEPEPVDAPAVTGGKGKVSKTKTGKKKPGKKKSGKKKGGKKKGGKKGFGGKGPSDDLLTGDAIDQKGTAKPKPESPKPAPQAAPPPPQPNQQIQGKKTGKSSFTK
jgi:hypothetical protein